MREYSPDIHLLDYLKEIRLVSKEYSKNLINPTALRLGGNRGRSDLIQEYSQTIVDLSPYENSKCPHIIADLCKKPLPIQSSSVDMTYSVNVMEHLKYPWIFAEECARITKSGGITIHVAPFSWRYHPVPIDTFRYSHTGLEVLFELYGFTCIISGYDISARRGDCRGRDIKNKMDYPPIDELGGWREHWTTLYIGRKK